MNPLFNQGRKNPDALPAWRILLAFAVAVALVVLVAYLVVPPIQRSLAERHLSRGDTYLQALDFQQAETEYTQALRYNPQLEEASRHLELAKTGDTDIAALREFFVARNAGSTVEQIDAATREFTVPKEALQAGVSLLESGQYRYARYPLERAVALDSQYPEAWHYLGQTYEKLMEDDASYREKRDAAFAERDRLTTRYLNQ